jgi:hypothetical protein
MGIGSLGDFDAADATGASMPRANYLPVWTSMYLCFSETLDITT